MEDINTDISNEQIPHQQPIQQYNQEQLIKESKTILAKYNTYDVREDNRVSLTRKIKNYINNIKEFYKRNDKETLKQLTNLIHNFRSGNDKACEVVVYMYTNIKFLYHKNFLTIEEYDELLKFHLFLFIMTNIQHHNQRTYIPVYKTTKRDYYCNYPIMINWKQYYINEKYKEGMRYEVFFINDVKEIMYQLASILIDKYFILDDPTTWIPRE